MIQTEKNFAIAAMKAGLDEKTARKYSKQGKLPSELKEDHVWASPEIHRLQFTNNSPKFLFDMHA